MIDAFDGAPARPSHLGSRILLRLVKRTVFSVVERPVSALIIVALSAALVITNMASIHSSLSRLGDLLRLQPAWPFRSLLSSSAPAGPSGAKAAVELVIVRDDLEQELAIASHDPSQVAS